MSSFSVKRLPRTRHDDGLQASRRTLMTPPNEYATPTTNEYATERHGIPTEASVSRMDCEPLRRHEDVTGGYHGEVGPHRPPICVAVGNVYDKLSFNILYAP
ncbi:hypothetical protein CEXT_201531 [Caerostris extrusa]|uniref:Uncharacterized protein n=1 Tax=Caerostris extrusa TaxID=172846 RepID=A0AAV4MSB6_CAEEX|nr:hypothetical protein CEXT_201531 [Caerostris extrusa]